jgi:hypothetical protein
MYKASSTILAALLAVAASLPILAQTPPPFSYKKWLELQGHPGALEQFKLPAPPAARRAAPLAAPDGSPWQSAPAGGVTQPSNPLLLTDGTVIVHNANASDWRRLTPDITGSYVNGTWSAFASLPSGYGPLYFGSAVLPDGRVVVNGGEYNFSNSPSWTNRGAIYDPLLGLWRSLHPPGGWANIGDAQTVVLNDGTYMLADALTNQQALLQSSCSGAICANLWVVVGSGKSDGNDEEGWTLLPSGDVLTVDASNCGNSERFVDATTSWVSAGNTGLPCGGGSEMGPAVLRPDGTVIAFAAVTSGAPDPTAIFDSATLRWSAGPNVPSVAGQNYTLADAPAALLPNGNVLFAASPGLFRPPVHFFEFDGQGFTQVADTPDAPFIASYYLNFLVLPTGQILATDFISVQIYTPSGAADPSWAPAIDTYPATITRGATYQLTGRQFNGLSHGAAYGDDAQAATNYPIVRLVNAATGHVFYGQTSGFNTMSVAPNTFSSTNFMVTGMTETGLSHLFVVANGIASQPVDVVVQ